jgi:hypothetical protein
MPKQTYLSASQCGVLLVNGTLPENKPFGVGAVNLAWDIAGERIGVQPEPDYSGYHTERGNELEWEALETYAERQLVALYGQQVWGVCPDFPLFGGTPDALVGDMGGVDAKAPNNANHRANIVSGAQVKDYYNNLQAYMMIFGRDWWDLASYNPNFPAPLNLAVIRVHRDDAWQSKMRERLPLFFAMVDKFEAELRRKMQEP